MSSFTPSVAELCEYRMIGRGRVAAAAVAYVAGDYACPFAFNRTYALDLDQAVRAHPFAAKIANDTALSVKTRREAARAAILLAHAVVTVLSRR